MTRRNIRHIDLLTMIPSLVVVLPCVGLLLLPIFPGMSPYSLGRAPSYLPFILCSIFAAIFVFSLLCTQYFLGRLKTVAPPAKGMPAPSLLLMLLALMLFVAMLTQVDAIALFRGDIYKGDLRVGGQVIAILSKFMLPSLFAYTCLTWRNDRTRRRLVSIFLVGAATFGAAFLLGTKAGALLAILPGVLVLAWGGMPKRVLLMVTVVCLVVVTVSSALFDTSGQGLAGSVNYVLNRAFLLTAEIPYRITQAALVGNVGIDYTKTLMSIFTKTALRHFIETPYELYQYSFSGAVSALFYPQMIPEINSGEWNHTPPIFTEGIVAFGPWFGLAAIFAGTVGGCLIYCVQFFVIRNFNILASLMITYFVFVYVSWLNSAGVAGLLHPFPLMALAMAGCLLVAMEYLGFLLVARRS